MTRTNEYDDGSTTYHTNTTVPESTMSAPEKELFDKLLDELTAKLTPEYLAWLDGLNVKVFQLAR